LSRNNRLYSIPLLFKCTYTLLVLHKLVQNTVITSTA